MNRKVLIASIGPYQFINALSYIFQHRLRDDVVGVIRYNYSPLSLPPDLYKCEKWLYDLFEVPFLGLLTSLYQIWGKDPFHKIIRSVHIKKHIRSYIQSKLDGVNIDEITDIIIPYRPDLQDVLLLNAFKNARVHFVADGFSLGFNTFVELPFPMYLTGITNPYKKGSNNEIFAMAGLESSLARLGRIITLDHEVTKLNIYNRIFQDDEFSRWFESGFGKFKPDHLSIFLLQPIDRYIGIDKEVDFYKKVIHQEHKSSNNIIMIKFHPRDQLSKIEFIQKELLGEFDNGVAFFPNYFFSMLPFEIFLDSLNVKKLIGITSTPLLFSNVYNSLESSVYCCKNFPEATRNSAREMANFLNTKITEY